MKRTSPIIVFSLLLLSTPAAGQQPQISYKSTEVAPGIVMLEGEGGFAGGNLGLWIGDDGVVLIDDGMQPLFDTMLTAIGQHVGRPVDFVVNTHVHGDHIGGNEGMSRAGATIVAHDNIRRRMIADGVRGPDGKTAPSEHMLPELTFSESMTLHLNGQLARLIHVSKAHTDGDAIIHFPDADVIHSGDVLFNGIYPYVDLDSGGSVDGYIAALGRVLSLAGKDTRIIAGHGPLATKADVEAARDMLMDVRDRVRSLIRQGKTEQEILAMNPLADYDADWTWGFINTERMTRMLIRDGGGSE